MKTRITVLLIALTMGLTTVSQAAFVVKKEAKTEQAATNGATGTALANESTATTATPEPKAHAKKHSSLHKRLAAGKAEISKGVYILLAIIGFGFLGIGLNENFEGINWLIGLLLCLLFWLPGLIYALIMMKNYYK